VLNLKLFRYFLLIFVGNWIRRLRNCFFYLQSIMISGLNIMKSRTFFCSFHLIESLFFSLEVDFYLVYDSILPSALLIVVLGQVLIIVHHLAWSGTVDKIYFRVGKQSTWSGIVGPWIICTWALNPIETLTNRQRVYWRSVELYSLTEICGT
jgi:hypothetical protein